MTPKTLLLRLANYQMRRCRVSSMHGVSSLSLLLCAYNMRRDTWDTCQLRYLAQSTDLCAWLSGGHLDHRLTSLEVSGCDSEAVALCRVDLDLVPSDVLAFVGSIPRWPVHYIQTAVLGERHAFVAHEVGVGKVAVLGSKASVSTALGIELAVSPLLEPKVSIVAVAVERSLDSATVLVDIGREAQDVWNAIEPDLLDVGVGSSHDNMELLLELAVVEGHVFGESALPQVALDQGSGEGVGTSWTHVYARSAFEEDVEGGAFR
jgi:hypothetical protein